MGVPAPRGGGRAVNGTFDRVWSGGRKETLQEYLEISSLVQDEVVTIHREMAAAVARIQPEAEYQGFLQQYG